MSAKEQNKKKIQSSEIRFLRGTIGFTFLHRKTNIDVWKELYITLLN